jgi:hypothetical protein
MTCFKPAFIASALAVIAVGCNADHTPPTATRVERGGQAKAVVSPAPATYRQETAVVQKSEKGDAYVIFGIKEDPKAAPPELRQGKGKGPAKFGHPTRPEEPAMPEEPTFTATGGFDSTKEKAKESAIRAAVEKLHDYLLEQNPPITKSPTTEMVRRMLIRHPGASEADAAYGKVTEQVIEVSGKNETMYQAEVAVKVRPEHIREMRARERSSEALWVLAGLGGLAGVLAVFFRIDAWTKGYLTSWLVLGTVGAAALLTGLWWFAR